MPALEEDLDFIRSAPSWQTADETGRRELIRKIAAQSAQEDPPEYHQQLTSALWQEADPDGMLTNAAQWTGNAVKEVALSIPAAGVAAGMAATDTVGISDTGSGTRLGRGVAELWDTAGQRIKQLMPGDKQEELAAALTDLQDDIHNNAVPQGFKSFLAGEEPEDDEGRQFVDIVGRGLARLAVQADHSDATPEQEAAYLASDRSLFSPAAREHLADYAVTRDPSSWAAFVERVTETDAKHITRLERQQAEQGIRRDLEDSPEWVQSMAERGMDMQTSPIDMASAVLPVLRGMKLFKAVKAGKRAASGGLTVDSLKEGGQEALTSYLEDARNTAGQIAEAGAMGVVGNAAVQAPFAIAGKVMQQPAAPVVPADPADPTDQTNLLDAVGDRQAAAYSRTEYPAGEMVETLDPGRGPIVVETGTPPAQTAPAMQSPTVPPPQQVPTSLGSSPEVAAPPPSVSTAALGAGPGATVPAPVVEPNLQPATEGLPTASASPITETAMPQSGPAGSVTAPPAIDVPPPTQQAPGQPGQEAVASRPKVRMAEKILTTQGVDSQTAAMLAVQMESTLPPDLAPEQYRERVLQEAQAAGFKLPSDLTRFSEDTAAYEAAGYSPEETAQHVANAAAHNAQQQAEMEAHNRGLAQRMGQPRLRMSKPSTSPVADSAVKPSNAPAKPTAGVNAANGKEAQRRLQAATPELAAGVKQVKSRAELNENDFHPKDWEALQTTEAFFNPRTGGVIVITDNVVIRPGETPIRAVIRATVHERIGHAGLAALRQQKDKSFAKRWQRLVDDLYSVPARALEIDAIGKERGYTDLAGNRSALAEEWFARQVEKLTDAELTALSPTSLLGKFWNLLKDALRRLTGNLARENWTTKELREIMALSKQALKDGGPVGDAGRVKLTDPGYNLQPSDLLPDGTPKPQVVAEIEAELADIERRAKADGSWMKAPNGQPTKLNEQQWKMTRTRRFKTWFGDWEAQSHNDYLNSDPVATMRGDEVPVFPKLNQLAKWIGVYWKTKHGGSIKRGDLGIINLDEAAASSSIGHGMGAVKGQAFYLVPDVLRNGRLLGKLPQTPNKPEAFLIAAPASIGGETFTILVEIRRDTNGQRLYVHEAIKRKLQTGFNSAAATSQGDAKPHSPAGAIRSFMEKLRSVKPDSVSKVVDENGEPMVVYHGTNAEFDTFDRARGRNAHYGEGFYFGTTPRRALLYGDTIKAAFLSIKTPTEGSRLANGYQTPIGDWVAKTDTQIKSATANVGTFSQQSGNIRFSMPQQPQQPQGPDQDTRTFGGRVREDPRISSGTQTAMGDAAIYDIARNADTFAAANALIDQHGLDGAEKILYDESNGLPGHVRVTLGQQLIMRMDKAARAIPDPAQRKALRDAAAKVLDYTDRKGTEAGQTVQAFAMWAKMSPEGVLLHYDRKLKEANGGRLPTLPPELLDKLGDLRDQINALPGDSITRAEKMHELLTELARFEGVPIGSLFASIWYANLLSGLTTQGINVWGNGLHLALRNMAAAFVSHPADTARMLGATMRGLAKGFSDAKAAFRGKHIMKGSVKYDTPSTSDYARNNAMEIALGKPPSDLKSWLAWIGSVGGITKYVFRSLQAADAVFWHTAAEGRASLAASRAARANHKPGSPAYFQSISDALGTSQAAFQGALDQAATEMKAAGMPVDINLQNRRAWELLERSRPEAVNEEAHRFADMATFNEDPRGVGAWIYSVIQSLQGVQIAGVQPLRALLPFARIPANLVSLGLDFTPVGALRAAVGHHLTDKKKETFTQPERLEKLAASMMGTLAGAIVYSIASQYAEEDDESAPFMLYGAGRGSKDKNATMPPGWKPFTIKVGDKYISYAETPLALMLAPLGALMDSNRYKTGLNEQSWAMRTDYLVRTMAGTVFSQGVLSSAADVMDVMGGKTPLAKLPSRFTSGMIPLSGMMRDITPLFDPVKISDDTVMAAILRDVPVVRHLYGKPALNIFGEPVQAEGLARVPVVKRMLATQGTHREANWMARNNLSVPGFDARLEFGAYLPAPQRRTVQESRAARAATMGRLSGNIMTAEENYTFIQRAGELTKQAVQRLMALPPSTSSDVLQDRLDTAVGAARKLAMRELAAKVR